MNRITTTALFAAALVAVGSGAEAQQRDAGDWWSPVVLTMGGELARAVADDERPWWMEGGEDPRDARDRRDGERRDRDDRADRERYEDRWEYDRDDDDRWEDRDDDARRNDRRDARRGQDRAGQGPPFCRNGQGHPTKGMQWCREKGWDRDGRQDDRRDTRWSRAGWEDVIFGGSRQDRTRQRSIGSILGDVILGRLADHGRGAGLGGAIDGRWLTTRAGDVLQLRMGGAPLAELTDADRDGRVDVVLLRR